MTRHLVQEAHREKTELLDHLTVIALVLSMKSRRVLFLWLPLIELENYNSTEYVTSQRESVPLRPLPTSWRTARRQEPKARPTRKARATTTASKLSSYTQQNYRRKATRT